MKKEGTLTLVSSPNYQMVNRRVIPGRSGMTYLLLARWESGSCLLFLDLKKNISDVKLLAAKNNQKAVIQLTPLSVVISSGEVKRSALVQKLFYRNLHMFQWPSDERTKRRSEDINPPLPDSSKLIRYYANTGARTRV